MKKIFGILMFAALLAGVASCSKEKPIEEPEKAELGLSFEFAAPRDPFVTRAGIATDPEWNIASLDVYIAHNGTMTKLVRGDEADYNFDEELDRAEKQKYQITMSPTWLADYDNEQVTFYFVGNAATSMKGAPTLSMGTEDDFKAALTNKLTSASGKNMELIEKPNWDGQTATKNLLFSDAVAPIQISGTNAVKGNLIRRVARFDVNNPEAISTADNAFIVTGIYVANAAEQGNVFGTAIPSTIGKADHIQIAPVDAADYTLSANLDLNPPLTVAPAVFYLYPTKIGSGATDTKIYVFGKSGANAPEIVMPVTADTDIVANHRYVLNVDVTRLKVILEKVDYEEGEIVPAPSGYKVNPAAPTVENLSGASVGDFNGGTLDFVGNAPVVDWEITAGATGEVIIEINSAWGTAYEIDTNADDISDHVTKVTVFDRDDVAEGVTDTYTINIDDTDDDTAVDAKLTIFGWDDDENGNVVINITRDAVTTP